MKIKTLTKSLFSFLMILIGVSCSGPAESGLMVDEIMVENIRCDMCKTTIESALKKVDGVRRAELAMSTGLVVVSHINSVSRKELVAAITNSGYHADNQLRNESAYEELPVCCK